MLRGSVRVAIRSRKGIRDLFRDRVRVVAGVLVP